MADRSEERARNASANGKRRRSVAAVRSGPGEGSRSAPASSKRRFGGVIEHSGLVTLCEASKVTRPHSTSRLTGLRVHCDKGKGIATEPPSDARGFGSRPSLPIYLFGGASAVGNHNHGMISRPCMEPLKLEWGRSFVKHFLTDFKKAIEVPSDFWNSMPEKNSRVVHVFGDVLMGFPVHVKVRENRVWFGKGWSGFVHHERISRGDTAVFAALGENKVGMRLYGADGEQKPLSARPPIGDPLLDDRDANAVTIDPALDGAAEVNGNPSDADVPVPRSILGIVFELGPKVLMDPAIMQLLANVWHKRESDFPIYVCSITRTNVESNPYFYFCRSYSRYLKNQACTLLLGAHGLGGSEALVARYPNESGSARITKGWNEFVHKALLQIGATYVVSILEDDGHYRITFHHVVPAVV